MGIVKPLITIPAGLVVYFISIGYGILNDLNLGTKQNCVKIFLLPSTASRVSWGINIREKVQQNLGFSVHFFLPGIISCFPNGINLE